jgi:hypothetical protein
MRLNRIPGLRGSRAKLAGAVTIALLAMAAFAGSAQACSYSGGSQVFSRWGDQRDYVLAPEGGFEGGGAGWSLSGGAKVVAGNESYYLDGAGDSKSLSLPAGSSAVSPPICMEIDTPVFRLMDRNTGEPSSRLRVEAVFSLLGLIHTDVVETLSGGSAWAPSQPISTVLGLSTIVGTLIPSSIEIRFRPLDAKGNWQIDDLYVDPFCRH